MMVCETLVSAGEFGRCPDDMTTGFTDSILPVDTRPPVTPVLCPYDSPVPAVSLDQDARSERSSSSVQDGGPLARSGYVNTMAARILPDAGRRGLLPNPQLLLRKHRTCRRAERAVSNQAVLPGGRTDYCQGVGGGGVG